MKCEKICPLATNPKITDRKSHGDVWILKEVRFAGRYLLVSMKESHDAPLTTACIPPGSEVDCNLPERLGKVARSMQAYQIGPTHCKRAKIMSINTEING